MHREQDRSRQDSQPSSPRRHSLAAALFLSALFTIALTFLTVLLPSALGYLLAPFFPDYLPTQWTPPGSPAYVLVETLRPVGYIALILTFMLIIAGFLIKRRSLTTTGSVMLWLPTFATFAPTMFFLAGMGVIRAIWLPLAYPGSPLRYDLLRLGDVVQWPVLVLHAVRIIAGWYSYYLLAGLAGMVFLVGGLAIFSMGTVSWLYGKFAGFKVIDLWVYRYSRHPQYLGFLTWSYAFIVVGPEMVVPGYDFVVPTLPWVVAALALVAAALFEEVRMAREHGEPYASYREGTPFLLPLPRAVTRFIVAPLRLARRKETPEDAKDILFVIVFYGVLLVLLSIPTIWLLDWIGDFSGLV